MDNLRRSPAKKGHLIFNANGLNVEVDVRFERMTTKDIRENHKVIRKDSKGRILVSQSFFEDTPVKKGQMHRAYVNPKGEVIPKEEIRFYQITNGKEHLVSPFQRTESIEIVKTLPKEISKEFQQEYSYEVWSENQIGLYKIAEYLEKHNLIGISRVVLVSGSFSEYMAIFAPNFQNGKFFNLIMTLTLKKKTYSHLLEIASAKRKKVVKVKKTTAKAKSLEIMEEL